MAFSSRLPSPKGSLVLHNLAAIALASWALLGPALCQAACAAPAPEVHHEHCETAPPAGEVPAPVDHAEEECCQPAVLGLHSAASAADPGAAPVPAVATPNARPEGDAPIARERPRRPDRANSPYAQVTPPRLVYAASLRA